MTDTGINNDTPASAEPHCSDSIPEVRISNGGTYRITHLDEPASTTWVSFPLLDCSDSEVQFLNVLFRVVKHFREYDHLKDDELKRAVGYFNERFGK